MKSLNCQKMKPLILWYIDQSLDPVQAQAVEHHLRVCNDCKLYADEFRTMYGKLGSIPSVTVSPVFHAKALQKLKSLPTQKVYGYTSSPIWNYARWAGAAAVMLLAIVLFVQNRDNVSPTKQTDKTMPAKSSPVNINVPIKAKQKLVQKQESMTQAVVVPTSIPKTEVKIQAESKGNEIDNKESVKEVVEQKTVVTETTVNNTKETEEKAVQKLIDKGIPQDTAQRTVDNAIVKGYSVNKLNEIVANPQKTTVRLSQKKGEMNQGDVFKFEEAAPNPFTPNGDNVNDKIFFKYQNPHGVKVEIRIYDFTDTLVKTIVPTDDTKPSWDGTNDNDTLSEGGIYVYVLKVEETVIKGTIILAK
ncbi:MAG: gliding motility-associated C-terminal domain-containing protein [Elusimicrobiota bacterium]